MKKPAIFLFTPYYVPGYKGGGPIQTISNMVSSLKSDYQFFIFTSDRDLGDSASYSDVIVDEWVEKQDVFIYYASPKNLSFFSVFRNLKSIDFDILYLNSLFSPRFTIYPLLLSVIGFVSVKKILIAPRGELSKGALALKSLKKKVFIAAARGMGLYKKCFWHVSTEFEKLDVCREINAKPERVLIAQNVLSSAGSILSESANSDRADLSFGSSVRVCFLSRISPMKNLDFALTVLQKVSVDIEFDIYGPTEDLDYWSACEELIRTLPKNVVVKYCGAVQHDKVRETIKSYDIFFVPSRGENFGHAFAEAFSAGVPVLVSDRTPWRDLQLKGVGWDFSLSQEQLFVDAIHEFAQYSKYAREEIRERCRCFYIDLSKNKDGSKENVEMFRQVLIQD